ncbi:ferrochelatase [Campylobacter pinnipediorum subsp. pinnipediorum]|uniref:ferrochelatase n=1 Tax=Campylobacter pinnipediorum TaxID=1965231 RepID=UPI0009954D84|nr:ferrochelatase [Campylobacter pinnipediorum]AQW84004.1 ferrochelatase [Campylobacter pinnipediorum subsp. pinnipediorum]
MKKMILLLNMGGPQNLDEVKVFLKNMFNDPYILGVKSNFIRKTLACLITNLRAKTAINNYKQIGSKSPICDITKSLCDKMVEIDDSYIVDFAMNYTPPFAKDVLEKYSDLDEIIVLPLYPHHSITTITSSLDEFYKAFDELGLKSKVKVIEPFYNDDIYNNIIINDIKEHVKNKDISDMVMIFSAHSLPEKIIQKGDKYEQHIVKHFDLLKEKLLQNGIKFKDIKLAYQSKLGPVKWLEPSLNDVLSSLDSKQALVYPMSFCIDNSETVFELCVEYKHISKSLEFEYYDVVKCPNDSDDFAKFLFKLSDM